MTLDMATLAELDLERPRIVFVDRMFHPPLATSTHATLFIGEDGQRWWARLGHRHHPIARVHIAARLAEAVGCGPETCILQIEEIHSAHQRDFAPTMVWPGWVSGVLDLGYPEVVQSVRLVSTRAARQSVRFSRSVVRRENHEYFLERTALVHAWGAWLGVPVDSYRSDCACRVPESCAEMLYQIEPAEMWMDSDGHQHPSSHIIGGKCVVVDVWAPTEAISPAVHGGDEREIFIPPSESLSPDRGFRPEHIDKACTTIEEIDDLTLMRCVAALPMTWRVKASERLAMAQGLAARRTKVREALMAGQS